MTSFFSLSIEGGVARLAFDNPRRLNAMNVEMWRALPDLLTSIESAEAVRVLVFEGAGERAFCSGNDVSEYDRVRADPSASASFNVMQLAGTNALRALTKPTIAAVHGYCLGAGLEISLLCDFRLCTNDARFGIPAVRLGLPYRYEDVVKLVDVIGLSRAREMILLGGQYGGEDAASFDLVHWCVSSRSELTAKVASVAAQLAANAPLSLRAAKMVFAELTRRDASPDLAGMQSLADVCYASRDYAEGRAALREKRKPQFEGR